MNQLLTLRGVIGVLGLATALTSVPLAASGAPEGHSAGASELTLYSGRGESIVDPLVRAFEAETGIRVRVRYAGTAELAVLLAEEGERSPADLFWAQDAGALGALARAGLLADLPVALAEDVPEANAHASSTGRWVATSGRARVFAYSTTRVAAEELPASVFDLTTPEYRERVGWAPTNGSFQAFVTALRLVHGEDAARRWLAAMQANNARSYRNNTALVEAIAAGEIDFAITNNYYLLRYRTTDPGFPVAQRFFADGDIGNLLNVAGVGVLRSSRRAEDALRFVRFLLEAEAQSFFTDTVYEYPVTPVVGPNPLLESFDRLLAASPRVDLDALGDLEGTLALLREAGLL